MKHMILVLMTLSFCLISISAQAESFPDRHRFRNRTKHHLKPTPDSVWIKGHKNAEGVWIPGHWKKDSMNSGDTILNY